MDGVLKCPECGSEDVVPIFYGFQTKEVKQKMQNGQLVFGALGAHKGLPTHKCITCHATFQRFPWNRAIKFLEGICLVSTIGLLCGAGYFVGRATILSDSVATTFLSQILADSFTVSSLTLAVVLWILTMFVIICFEAISITRRIRLVDRLGIGYVVGNFLSALSLTAWVTLVIEAIALVFIIVANALLD